jgi:hypothetical protein
MVRECAERQRRRRHDLGRRSRRVSARRCTGSDRWRCVHGNGHESKRGVNRRLDQRRVATALITKSPDLSIRAVFFAALADGSIQQVHVQKGVDQLAPPGSFTPIAGISTDAAESANPDVVTRAGMIFNWVPTRVLYVSDPLADRILALDISDESSDPATSSSTLFLPRTRGISRRSSLIAPSTSPRRHPKSRRGTSPAIRRLAAAPTSTSSIAGTTRSSG